MNDINDVFVGLLIVLMLFMVACWEHSDRKLRKEIDRLEGNLLPPGGS